MANDLKKLDWPGWPSKNNPFGGEFDLVARKRMISGSRQLLPLLRKYKREMGKIVLEVGPFFNPLVTPREFPRAKIFYWENDRHVLAHLKKIYNEKVFPIYCNLNAIEGTSLLKLKMETKKYFKKLGIDKISFDSVVASHVFNYIDYKLFLLILREFISPRGLIFINNVVDYGLPLFFSERRPKSIQETVRTIKDSGYSIVEKKILDSRNLKYQRNKRLLVAARRNEK